MSGQGAADDTAQTSSPGSPAADAADHPPLPEPRARWVWIAGDGGVFELAQGGRGGGAALGRWTSHRIAGHEAIIARIRGLRWIAFIDWEPPAADDGFPVLLRPDTADRARPRRANPPAAAPTGQPDDVRPARADPPPDHPPAVGTDTPVPAP